MPCSTWQINTNHIYILDIGKYNIMSLHHCYNIIHSNMILSSLREIVEIPKFGALELFFSGEAKKD